MAPKNLVVDSSVVVKWLNRKDEANTDQADKLFFDGQKGKVNLILPELAKYEVGNALLFKGLDLPMTKISLEAIYSLPASFFPMDRDLAMRTLEIAFEAKITYYDAIFIALAEKLDAVLVTDNPKHQKKITGIQVLPLKDYLR